MAGGLRPRPAEDPAQRRWLVLPVPVALALESASDLDGGLRAAEQAAQEGMKATTPLVARKGRASYLGERSAGHQDPGATSTYYLFKSATEALAG